MADIVIYRETIRKYLQDYANLVASSALETEQAIETEVVFDTEHDHYQLVNVGWQDEHRIYGCVVHIDIKDDKLWIQHNGTELPVAEDLARLGIPKDHIVLGFQAPIRRQYSDFAVN
ncbi:FdxN element excision controlling factor protein [Candidatus Vecturithrix granuli]|uniref:FdxN element excision controlling factor protein n=1 Tax=Vecturithrix granuli TaxID=1499967 RepID=A0A081C7P3_VECG1|nr:FdxN element excision controlling factor protein [Candidatus Vecturithrix granuli]